MAAKPDHTKNAKNSSGNRKNEARKQSPSTSSEISFRSEVILLAILGISILLFISNFGFGGFIGAKVSALSFGLFGMMAYLIPIAFFVGAAFYVSNKDNGIAMVKLVAGILFVSFLCMFVELVVAGEKGYSLTKSFQYAVEHKNGGGALGGLLASVLCPAIGKAGTYVVDVVILIISLVILTERSFFGGVKKGSRKVYDTAREDAARRRNVRKSRREAYEQRRMDRKVEGVALDTKIHPVNQEASDNLSELKLPEEKEQTKTEEIGEEMDALSKRKEAKPQTFSVEPVVVEKVHRKPRKSGKSMSESIQQESSQSQKTISLQEKEQESLFFEQRKEGQNPVFWEQHKEEQEVSIPIQIEEEPESPTPLPKEEIQEIPVTIQEEEMHEIPVTLQKEEVQSHPVSEKTQIQLDEAETFAEGKPISAEYVFPPISLLKQGNAAKGDSMQHLQETAMYLQQILKNFGVNVTITDVSCGPTVTRYELQPEMGVKVSKIVNLADDIKLNLAAADIRIEAPIPGKAAVGIEVPNKENVMVRFREMIEASEFQNHKSNICFTAGKDIGGQVIVADIAKMPHLLIAGATGSGKSVCINTIIMSLLYKANPDDVKLILIDPKVVELSVYNGIPHLFIPVVTDPKKAAGALHWAVAEMTDRYQKFADYQVRDLKGYNQKVEAIEDVEDETKPQKLPQIVIVVDELADLMMVAPGDVEDAICRLAQLARAAGIHLIIATQRPSVDVITGLIKANMPSRIAFSVSSGVDSRTILDMNGAEKLLGNGDMLFYPQGYQKPLRVQGPFVSDSEVEAVVDFLKKQSTVVYNTDIEEKMNTVSISSGNMGAGGGDQRDAYFVEAGKFVIEKDKGSIGMLQRMFKIGFNRAARIMDQLEEAGVVGAEEGTKPRKILMSLSEFEEYIDEYV